MAFDGGGEIDKSFAAAADLSTHQFKLVYIDANGRAALGTAYTSPVMGVLQNKPAAADDVARVRMIGISKVKCGAALNESDFIASNGEGFGTATTLDTAYYVGRVLVATGGSGELGEIMVNPGKYPG